MDASLLPLVLFLVASSALLSASEVTFFSLSRFQLRFLRESFPRAYSRIRALLSDPSGVLLTVLVLNEVCNVGLSTLIASEVTRHDASAPWWQIALKGIGFSLPILILFCEVTPKIIAARLNQLLAPPLSGIVMLFYRLMAPLRHLVGALRLVNKKTKAASAVDESDFLVMVEQGHREGNIHTSEFSLIRRVFDLDDTKAAEIMTPVSQLTLLPADMKVAEAADHMERHRLFRVPVYREARNKIVGILYAKDVLELVASQGASAVSTQKVADLAREPFIVNSDSRINHIFRQMRLNQTHLAVVADGKRALGVVTMADILGELFEDLGEEEGVIK